MIIEYFRRTAGIIVKTLDLDKDFSEIKNQLDAIVDFLVKQGHTEDGLCMIQ